MANDRVFKTPADLILAFENWAFPLTTLTPDQLLTNFSDTYKISPQELAELTEYLRTKPAQPPPPPPPEPLPAPPKPKPPTVQLPVPGKPKPPEQPPEKPPAPPPEPTTPTPKIPVPPPPTKPTVKPELIIERTPYPKWWKDEGVAPINLQSPGSQMVISARSDYSLYIGAIVLTVTGETDIAFTFGQFGASGAISLGGSDEPRGIVIAMGNSPAPCGSGSFVVTSNGEDAYVGGFVTYFLWKK